MPITVLATRPTVQPNSPFYSAAA